MMMTTAERDMTHTNLTVISSTSDDTDMDSAANRAIRTVATTPSPEHVIPAPLIAELYRHVDAMRTKLLAGECPEVVLSFEVTDKRTLGHYVIRRNAIGVRWNINLNLIHFSRPMYQVLATLLHEMAHAWQHQHGTPSKPPHHNAEFREKCAALGIPTDHRGHDLGVTHGSPFEAYCRAHGVAWPSRPGEPGEPTTSPAPVLPAPPAKPSGSKLKKWSCGCTNVRVAVADFDATCNRCGNRFERKD